MFQRVVGFQFQTPTFLSFNDRNRRSASASKCLRTGRYLLRQYSSAKPGVSLKTPIAMVNKTLYLSSSDCISRFSLAETGPTSLGGRTRGLGVTLVVMVGVDLGLGLGG